MGYNYARDKRVKIRYVANGHVDVCRPSPAIAALCAVRLLVFNLSIAPDPRKAAICKRCRGFLRRMEVGACYQPIRQVIIDEQWRGGRRAKRRMSVIDRSRARPAIGSRSEQF